MHAPRFVDDTVPTSEAMRLHQMVRRDGIPLMDVAREFGVKPPRAHQILTMMDEVGAALKMNSSLPGVQGEHGQ